MSSLSVIVPVYNVEAYLEDCLDSLREQVLNDIEIICVNDGSTDGSRDILTACAKRDPRIVIVDKPNGGLSSARNAGIERVASPYVCFLDSDDRMPPEACGEIVRQLDWTGADVLTFGATWVPADDAPAWMARSLAPRDVEYNGFDPALLFGEASRPFAWRTACRTDFLREQGIRFDESLRFGEDQVFHFAVYPRAGKTVLSSKRLYEYRLDRPGSLMMSIQGDLFSKLSAHLEIVRRIFADWSAGGLMDLCPAELVAFAVDFVAYDALKLPDAEYREIAGGLGKILLTHWGARDLRGMNIKPQAKRIALDACCKIDMPRAARMMLAFRYFVELNGAWSVFRRIVCGNG